jgi:hypothetical protein
MYGGDDGEDEGGAQEAVCQDPDPAQSYHLQQQNKKDGADLRAGVRFAKDAGAEVAQAGDHEEHATEQENRNVAAEYYDCVLPRNLALDGKYEKHCAHQKLVGDWVEILAEQGLLMELAGQQAVESVAEARENEKRQRPFEIVLHYVDDDEGQEDHAQQRELIGRGQDLAQVHRIAVNAWSLRRVVSAMGTLWRFLFAQLRRLHCVSHLRSEAGGIR